MIRRKIFSKLFAAVIFAQATGAAYFMRGAQPLCVFLLLWHLLPLAFCAPWMKSVTEESNAHPLDVNPFKNPLINEVAASLALAGTMACFILVALSNDPFSGLALILGLPVLQLGFIFIGLFLIGPLLLSINQKFDASKL